MKLSQFKTAVRHLKTPPRLNFRTPLGNIVVELQKGSLMNAVSELLDNDKGAETELYFDPNGFLCVTDRFENSFPRAGRSVEAIMAALEKQKPSSEDDEDDDEDLLSVPTPSATTVVLEDDDDDDLLF